MDGDVYTGTGDAGMHGAAAARALTIAVAFTITISPGVAVATVSPHAAVAVAVAVAAIVLFGAASRRQGHTQCTDQQSVEYSLSHFVPARSSPEIESQSFGGFKRPLCWPPGRM